MILRKLRAMSKEHLKRACGSIITRPIRLLQTKALPKQTSYLSKRAALGDTEAQLSSVMPHASQITAELMSSLLLMSRCFLNALLSMSTFAMCFLNSPSGSSRPPGQHQEKTSPPPHRPGPAAKTCESAGGLGPSWKLQRGSTGPQGFSKSTP